MHTKKQKNSFFKGSPPFFLKRKKTKSSLSREKTFYTVPSSRGEKITKNDDLLLDSNHTHYLLFDDGSQGDVNKNHGFRLNFVNELRKSIDENNDTQKIPMVLIVVQGGVSTLKAIEEALNFATPILLIAVN